MAANVAIPSPMKQESNSMKEQVQIMESCAIEHQEKEESIPIKSENGISQLSDSSPKHASKESSMNHFSENGSASTEACIVKPISSAVSVTVPQIIATLKEPTQSSVKVPTAPSSTRVLESSEPVKQITPAPLPPVTTVPEPPIKSEHVDTKPDLTPAGTVSAPDTVARRDDKLKIKEEMSEDEVGVQPDSESQESKGKSAKVTGEDGRGGRRVRRKTDRLSDVLDKDFNAREMGKLGVVEISVGSGVKLGDLVPVERSLRTANSLETRIVHRVVFGRVGKEHSHCSNLKKFNGFSFDQNSELYAKKLSYLNSRKLGDLRTLQKVLCLKQSGMKDQIPSRILDFLMKPDASQLIARKRGPGPKKAPSSEISDVPTKNLDDGDAESDYSESILPVESEEEATVVKKKETRGRKPGSKNIKRKLVVDGGKSGEATKKPRENGDLSWLDDILDDVVTSPPPLPTLASNSKKTVKKTPAKKKPGTPKKAKVTEEEEVDEETGSTRKLPTDAMITQAVRDLLADADLERVTMKTVCQQVFDKYPSFDLTHKRELIKKAVKHVLSTS